MVVTRAKANKRNEEETNARRVRAREDSRPPREGVKFSKPAPYSQTRTCRPSARAFRRHGWLSGSWQRMWAWLSPVTATLEEQVVGLEVHAWWMKMGSWWWEITHPSEWAAAGGAIATRPVVVMASANANASFFAKNYTSLDEGRMLSTLSLPFRFIMQGRNYYDNDGGEEPLVLVSEFDNIYPLLLDSGFCQVSNLAGVWQNDA